MDEHLCSVFRSGRHCLCCGAVGVWAGPPDRAGRGRRVVRPAVHFWCVPYLHQTQVVITHHNPPPAVVRPVARVWTGLEHLLDLVIVMSLKM